MTITELIAALEVVRAEHGGAVPVLLESCEWSDGSVSLEPARIGLALAEVDPMRGPMLQGRGEGTVPAVVVANRHNLF